MKLFRLISIAYFFAASVTSYAASEAQVINTPPPPQSSTTSAELASTPAIAESSSPAATAPIVRAELTSTPNSIEAGKSIKLILSLHHPEGWHSYTKEYGDAGLPTRLLLNLPDGFTSGEIEWPPAEKFSEGNLTTYGYSGFVNLPLTINIPQNLSETSYKISAKAEWLVCKDICIPEEQLLSIELPVSSHSAISEQPQNSQTTQSATDAENAIPTTNQQSLAAVLGLALIGGLILNLMPCVLPILSLKALALVKKSGKFREHTARHGVAYTAGVLLSFATIAALLIILQKGGEAIGWGYQMQFPAFVGFLVYLLFSVGLSLSGAFHLPALLGGIGSNIGNNMGSEPTLSGSFFTGVMAATVATPCTAPFMASAIGAALTMPAATSMLVFITLGFGLALPFLVISIFPSTLGFLPKPGAWMLRFKEFLAFPVYCSVIWLLWVLGLQSGIEAVTFILAGMLFIVFALWFTRWHFLSLVLSLLVITFTLFKIAEITPSSSDGVTASSSEATHVPYSKTALEALRSEGKAVYIDATAAWCITCQINKRVLLENSNVSKVFAEQNITLMVADWTRKNQEITEFLHEFGYNGVPLNVFYPADGSKPIVLPQLLQENDVIAAISGEKSN